MGISGRRVEVTFTLWSRRVHAGGVVMRSVTCVAAALVVVLSGCGSQVTLSPAEPTSGLDRADAALPPACRNAAAGGHQYAQAQSHAEANRHASSHATSLATTQRADPPRHGRVALAGL